MAKSTTAAKSTRMTAPDAARIYRATAVNGDGSIPKDSFAARAMKAAMQTTPAAKPPSKKK